MAAGLRVDPTRGLVRGLRAAVLTVPAVSAAAATHVQVDGCASWLAVVVAGAVCWSSAVAVLGARRPLVALLAWVVLAQVVTHVLLEQRCAEVVSGQVTLGRHLVATATPWMLAAHGCCAVLTAAVLQRADAALWAAHGLLASSVRVLSGRVVRAVPPPPRPRAATPAPAPQVKRIHDVWRAPRPVRRGPPALSLR